MISDPSGRRWNEAPLFAHEESIAHGRKLRESVPRSAHAAYEGTGRDPLEILATQNASRVQELVPLRMGRMLESPFTFYRGTASIMAADLAGGISTGITVVACGDAHLSNFGLFASPQRSLVFDLNDFDEAAVAPWEWDLKRLVTSIIIGARANGFDEEEVRLAALQCAAAYRAGIAEMMQLSAVQRYYYRADTATIHDTLHSRAQKVLDRATRHAMRRTSDAFVDKITERAADGSRVIIENPPVLTHISAELEAEVVELFELYLATVPADIALLLSKFQLTDVARRVVGVGSVGTRCFILILTGPKEESIVLQIKEAQPSVLESHGGAEPRHPAALAGRSHTAYESEGHRVVAGQRILQAVSDSFLGHFSADGHDYYVRQFRDRKGSIDTALLRPREYSTYGQGCGALLARAHSQSPTAPQIAGYIGSSPVFDRAIVDWSFAYAEQSLADYELFAAAVADGSIEALTGV